MGINLDVHESKTGEVVQMLSNIDKEFEDFVRRNYKKLSETERKFCEQLGISCS